MLLFDEDVSECGTSVHTFGVPKLLRVIIKMMSTTITYPLDRIFCLVAIIFGSLFFPLLRPLLLVQSQNPLERLNLISKLSLHIFVSETKFYNNTLIYLISIGEN